MRIISATIGPIASASTTSISALSGGTIAGGTALTLTSSPYVLSKPSRITITSTGNDTGVTFTIVGTDWNGSRVTETMTGGNAGAATNSYGNAYSAYDYSTIISITPNTTTASTVSAGTSAIASTRPIFLDEYAFAPTSIQVNVAGTANATVRQSLDDPNAVGYTNVNWVNHPDSTLVGLTSTVQGNYAYQPKIVQLFLNSGATSTSSVTIRISQSASSPF
jgi:hypothetical protein